MAALRKRVEGDSFWPPGRHSSGGRPEWLEGRERHHFRRLSKAVWEQGRTASHGTSAKPAWTECGAPGILLAGNLHARGARGHFGDFRSRTTEERVQQCTFQLITLWETYFLFLDSDYSGDDHSPKKGKEGGEK